MIDPKVSTPGQHECAVAGHVPHMPWAVMAADSVIPVSVACRCGLMVWRAEPVRKQWAPLPGEPESLGSIMSGSALVREALARQRAASDAPWSQR